LTATGKSTMLNKLYGQNVAETGIGETTGQIKSYKTKDFVLWDIPGKNDEVSYMSMQYISFFKGLTRRLILVTHTLKENSGMMKFMDAIGLDYDVVVNKMDRYDEEERPEFCAKIQEEKQTIGLKGVGRIFFVSAKFPRQFPDWLDMVHYLSIPPE
jgi:GTP-binding protein EngB required for normal cell division